MFYRIVIVLGLVVLTSCTTAKMAMDPGLEVDSEKHMITERPTFFSDSDLVFGPYKATNIDRGWINSSGSFTTIDEHRFGDTKKRQDYTYLFTGKNSWNGVCKVKKGHSEASIVSYGYYADINCSFVPVERANTAASAWRFRITGETSGTAKGSIDLGSETITVKAINKIEGSPLAMNQYTGYYFYSGQTIIAGVDAISKEGPVWLSKNLSQDEKDIIGMVVAALLLNSTW